MLFFIDVAEGSGCTIDQQLTLFENIKPLFTTKPLVLVATKIDIVPLHKLDVAHRTRVCACHSLTCGLSRSICRRVFVLRQTPE